MGKSTSFKGKTNYKCPFSIAILVHQSLPLTPLSFESNFYRAVVKTEMNRHMHDLPGVKAIRVGFRLGLPKSELCDIVLQYLQEYCAQINYTGITPVTSCKSQETWKPRWDFYKESTKKGSLISDMPHFQQFNFRNILKISRLSSLVELLDLGAMEISLREPISGGRFRVGIEILKKKTNGWRWILPALVY